MFCWRMRKRKFLSLTDILNLIDSAVLGAVPVYNGSTREWRMVAIFAFHCGFVVQSLSCVWLFVIHELQHARLPCSPLSPGVWSKSCPLSLWCYLAISSSTAPFSVCPQSFPASGYFPVKSAFHIRGPKCRSFSFSTSPSSESSGLIPLKIGCDLAVQGLSRIFSSTTIQKRVLNMSHFPKIRGYIFPVFLY